MIINLADVLEAAADDIATNGLAKHKLENGAGQHCAIGAIGAALGATFEYGDFALDFDIDFDGIEAAAEAIVGQIDSPTHMANPGGHAHWNQLVMWNNHPDRTADDVAEAMRLAAKDLRNQAQVAP